MPRADLLINPMSRFPANEGAKDLASGSADGALVTLADGAKVRWSPRLILHFASPGGTVTVTIPIQTNQHNRTDPIVFTVAATGVERRSLGFGQLDSDLFVVKSGVDTGFLFIDVSANIRVIVEEAPPLPIRK